MTGAGCPVRVGRVDRQTVHTANNVQGETMHLTEGTAARWGAPTKGPRERDRVTRLIERNTWGVKKIGESPISR